MSFKRHATSICYIDDGGDDDADGDYPVDDDGGNGRGDARLDCDEDTFYGVIPNRDDGY